MAVPRQTGGAPSGSARIARCLAQHVVEASQGFEILGELADGLDRLVKVAAIQLGEMSSRNANRIHPCPCRAPRAP